jgi:hypothetical protein
MFRLGQLKVSGTGVRKDVAGGRRSCSKELQRWEMMMPLKLWGSVVNEPYKWDARLKKKKKKLSSLGDRLFE